MVIIKMYEKFICNDTTNAAYIEISKLNEKGERLDRKEAMRRIKEKRLVIAFKSKYGTIWDTQNKDFYNKYKGKSKRVKEVQTP